MESHPPREGVASLGTQPFQPRRGVRLTRTGGWKEQVLQPEAPLRPGEPEPTPENHTHWKAAGSWPQSHPSHFGPYIKVAKSM